MGYFYFRFNDITISSKKNNFLSDVFLNHKL